MINIFSGNAEKIVAICERDCIGLKAIEPLISYGIQYDSIAMYWTQTIGGNVTAFISKKYNDRVAFLMKDSDAFEIASFLKVIGYYSLTTNSKKLIDYLTYKESDTDVPCFSPSGYIMKLPAGSEYIGTVTDISSKIFLNRQEDCKVFYETLNENFPGNVFSNYSDWYVDISHRVRHDTMDFAVVLDGGCKATASALVKSEHSVLLGAISTSLDVRGKHYAQTLIELFCSKYRNKDIFIMCAKDKVTFYEKQGFKNEGIFYSI